MRSTLILLLTVALLAGCDVLSGILGGTKAPDVSPTLASTVGVNDCPHTYTWTSSQKQQLAAEDNQLTDESMAHRAINEDHDLRAQIAANPNCKG